MKKTLLAIIALLFTLNLTASAQSALDGFDPNANGLVRIIVVQPNGKILIGGRFTTVLGVTRNHIARLNADGTLDTSFNPNASNDVAAIAVQGDGKILVGGLFTSIGGQTRHRIARLDATTGQADSFDPDSSDYVSTIVVQPNGQILTGGFFAGIGGATRHYIARLDATTGLADTFNPDASDFVSAIAVQADGKILVGGFFTEIGGQSRNCIARLDAVTGMADSFNPHATNLVNAIAVQADGKILAGGIFNGPNGIGGQTRNYIARLDAVNGLADTWNPNANGDVDSIAVQADGKILAGGGFNGTNSIGGQSRNCIARLDAVTGLADLFNPTANDEVMAIAVQQDGKVLAGGFFTTLAPNGGPTTTRNRIARIGSDGRLDQTLDLGIIGSQANTIAVQPDGKILIAGVFSSVLGVTRNNIARLNADGTLDTAFDPNSNGTPYAIAVQKDGRILVCGVFTNIGGQPRNRIARLTAVTGAADSFDPNSNGEIDSITVQTDSNILVSGLFSNIGGQARNSIARLDAASGLADSFNPNANARVYSIAVQADGKIVAGGQFSSIGGATRNYLARLDATTGLADSFDPNGSGPGPEPGVYAVVVQADGKILACGRFSTIGGQTRNNIARLDAVTGLADSWDPNASVGLQGVYSMAVQADGKVVVGFGGGTIGGQPRSCIARLDPVTGLADSFDPNSINFVYAVAMQADGKILAGGAFSGANSIGGQTRNYFARLSNDAAALQNVAVTPTTVTWTRGGSSPQFSRVTFESSTDNVNYTPLGNGTASGSNWTLTGLSLPSNQNFYVRARGYYRGSFESASESIAESVRNGFFGPPTVTSANGATFTVGAAGSFTVTTTGIPGGASVALSKSGALPSGVTFVDNNNGTATIVGTPGVATGGSYPITLTANNGVAPNGTQSFTLIVNESPRINSTNSTTFTVGAAGTFTVTTDRGFPAPPLSKSGALPSGVTFTDNGNGSATLAGTPSPGTAGSYPITITANNGVAPNANQSFSLTVNAPTLPPTVQFSATNYNVTEDCTFLDLTVTRTGDTSGASTVDFATADGGALQRTDYTIGSGTVSFAAGESSKTFAVLITEDHYVEGAEQFSVTLSNPTGATLGNPGAATVTINDDDTAQTPSPTSKSFGGTLGGGQETPANVSTAKGQTLVEVSADETTAKVSLNFSGLSSAQTAAHIHGPGARGVSAPILFPLPNGNFNNFQISLTAQQVSDLKAGLLYVNVHSNTFPNGEIRAQLEFNPIDNVDLFVGQHYHDFLSRQGDVGGQQFWTNAIIACGNDAACVRDKRVDVSNAFFYELEFQQTASYVYRLYRAAYGNTQPFPNPDNSNATEANKLPSYAVFARDRARVAGSSNLAQDQLALANLFVSRAEFTARYAANLSGAQFIAAVLANIQAASGVDLSSQTAALTTLFNSGGRGAVLYRLADDNVQTNPINNRSFIDAEYNRAFVTTQYFGYLRRDADIGGFLFWLGQVNGAPLRDVPRQHAMVCSFTTSAEFQLRFSSVVTHGNSDCPQ